LPSPRSASSSYFAPPASELRAWSNGHVSTFVAWQVFYGWITRVDARVAVTAAAIAVGLAFAVLLGLALELAVFRWIRTRSP